MFLNCQTSTDRECYGLAAPKLVILVSWFLGSGEIMAELSV